MDSIRQKIVDAVGARLATISIANGYQTDIGTSVFEWRATPFSSADLPAITYREESQIIAEQAFGVHSVDMDVSIDVYEAAGNQTLKNIRMVVADIYQAVGVDETWGNLAQLTVPSEDSIDVDHQTNVIGGATVNLKIRYATKKWDPYTGV